MVYKMYDGTIVRVDERLINMPTAQCGVRFDAQGGIDFISYSTKVINIDPLGWLTCSGTYSATTRKHIGAFLKLYAPNICYQDAKYCYENKKTINVYTGEIADLS